MCINIIDIPNFVESSQDKVNPESENQISREVDSEAVEMCPKVTHTCEGPSENSMEVTERDDVLPPQLVVLQEEVKSVEEPNVVVSPEESRPPEVTIDPGTSREASGVPCLNPRRGLTLLSPVCRDPAIGV